MDKILGHAGARNRPGARTIATRIVAVRILAVAGAAVFLSGPADAGLRLGPGAVLGLLAASTHMMNHIGGMPDIRRESRRHPARPQDAVAATPPAAPAPAEPSTPASSASATQSSPAAPVVEARAEAAHAFAPSRAVPPTGTAWPSASASVYEDLLGYVLWPGDYADRLWGHGYGDIMSTLLAPTTADTDRKQAASLIQNGMCSTQASELADHLVARTAEIIGPTPEQKAALDALRAGLGEAIERGRAVVCSGPGDPLKHTVDGLWTMWDATLLLRAPLEQFYDSLTPAQQAKLGDGAAAAKTLARACAEHSADWPSDRLASALGPDQQQRLAALRQQSSALIKLLAASCPRETEATPMDRLTAASDRMNALLYVAMSLSPALSELQSPAGGPNPTAGGPNPPAAAEH